MKKETFVSIINAIKAQDEHDNRNGKLISQLTDPEFQQHGIIFTTPMVHSVIEALEQEFSLTTNGIYGSEVSYFIYDLNYGQNKMAVGCITRNDGSKVNLTTPEELYDWIIENNEKSSDL